jgi:hypothetical protein
VLRYLRVATSSAETRRAGRLAAQLADSTPAGANTAVVVKGLGGLSDRLAGLIG